MENLRRMLKQLTALNEALAEEKTHAALCAKLAQKAAKIANSPFAAVISYYNNSTIEIVTNGRRRSAMLSASPPFPVIARRWSFKKRGVLVVTKTEGDLRLDPEFVRSHKIRSLIAAPIFIRGEIAGMMLFANRRGGFTEFHASLAAVLATQAGIALEAVALRIEQHRHARQISVFKELVPQIAVLRDSDLFLKTAVKVIEKHFSYSLIAAGWVDAQAREIRFVQTVVRKAKNVSKREIRVPTSKGLAGKAVRTGSTVYSKNIPAKSANVFPSQARSAIASPVKISGAVAAVIEIQSDRADAYDESDRTILEAVTSTLACAIHNATSYQNLERINNQLEESAKMKEEILQIVAHDFRSPLTVIRGYMDQLLRREKWVDEQQREIMQTVSQQAFRLQKLTDATMKASRFDSGDIPFTFEKTDFNSFLRHLVFPYSEKHEFVIKADENIPLIKGDSGRLQEAMENLLSNAIKYSPEGGNIRIEVRKVTRKDVENHFENDPEQFEFLLVSVSDQGIGIPADKKDLLFRRFARIHESRRIEGIGLGLYITRKIIEAHGGKIWLEEQEKGARFSFALPEYHAASEENIVVIEDDTLTLQLLRRAISNLGYEVITAWDGNEAMDKIFRFHPRLIVTDLMLPGMSGEEIIRRLRLNPELASIPIIVFTGKRDYSLQHAMENSVRLVFKHQGIGSLIAMVEELLSPNRPKPPSP